MIWPELWLFLLAVVRRKHLCREWAKTLSSRRQLDRCDYHHLMADEGSGHWRRPPRRPITGRAICACPKCVEAFEPFLQWVRIA